jgi:hypothetical protein
MCVFGAAFIFFFWYFGLDGTQINGNLSLLLESFFTTALLPVGLYGGLYWLIAVLCGWDARPVGFVV